MSTDTPRPEQQEEQQSEEKPPTLEELWQLVDALGAEVRAHLAREKAMNGATSEECPTCLLCETLRERAEQAGDYSTATDWAVLRRRHPTHTVYVPTRGGRG